MKRPERVILRGETRLFSSILLAIILSAFAAANAFAAPFAYIPNHYSGSVSVIDTSTNIVVATVNVGGWPTTAAVNPAGTRVYVSDRYSSFVSVIDTSTNTVIATVNDVGNQLIGVAVNPAGTRVYVTAYYGSKLAVIDTSTNAVVKKIDVGDVSHGVAVNPAGTRVYVANWVSSSVSVIDTSTDTVVATVNVGGGPNGVAVNPAGTQVYVTNWFGWVSVIDANTNTVVKVVNVETAPTGIAINPAGTRVYVANRYGSVVSVIDTSTNTVVNTIYNVGSQPTGVAVNPAGTRVYVADFSSPTVFVIDTSTNTRVATIGVGSGSYAAYGIFIGPDVTPQCAEAPPGLVSWWPGEGNADDIVNGNDGTLQNGVTFAPGKVGQAFSFDGVDDFVKIPASANLDVGLGSGFTLDAWINPADASTYRPLFEWNNGAGQFGPGAVFWIVPGAALAATLVDTAGAHHAVFTPGGIVQAGVWQHVALTYEKQTGIAKIYLNGNLVATLAVGTFTPQTSYDLYLGHRPPIGVPHEHRYVGLMDEAEVFNRALSAQEIQAIFNAGSAGMCQAPTDTTPPSTTATRSVDPNANGWNNSNVTVNLAAVDDEGGSGVKEIHYSLNGGPETVVSGNSASVAISAEGTTVLTYFARDNAGNQEAQKTLTAKIDKTPPSIIALRTPGPNADGWNNTDVTVSFTCSDGLSGIDSCGPTPQVVTTEGMEQSRSGTAVDKAGNTASTTVSGINIDKTAPVLSNVPGPIVVGQTGLAGTPVTVPMPTATDNYGPVVLTSDAPALFPLGITTVTFTAKDPAGNTATASTTVTVVETPGRMHGEGHLDADGKRYHFEFSVRDRTNGQEGGRLHFRVREHRPGRERDEQDEDRGHPGRRFVSTTIAPVIFSDTPGITPGRRPQPTMDTVEFAGTGRWDGKAGYTFTARATDTGEPGRGRDTFAITIKDSHGAVVATVAGTLSGGNIQSLRLRP
jgi:YVTN family beta-propeller protein